MSEYNDHNRLTGFTSGCSTDALTAYLESGNDTYNAFDPSLDNLSTDPPNTSSSPSPQMSLGRPPSLIVDSKSEADRPVKIEGLHPYAHSDANLFYESEAEEVREPATSSRGRQNFNDGSITKFESQGDSEVWQ